MEMSNISDSNQYDKNIDIAKGIGIFYISGLCF